MSPAIRLFVAFLLLPVVAAEVRAQLFISSHFTIEQLAPGVFAAIATDNGYAGANAGIVDLGGKTIVFDTFLSPIAARDLLRAADQLTHTPVAFVVNSHFHNDHIRGNQVFSPDVEIISTEKTREAISLVEPQQRKWEIQNVPRLLENAQESLADETDPFARRDLLIQMSYYKAINESGTELKTRLPNVTFEKNLTIHGTSRKVELLYIGGGHTPGDCIMLLPDEHIAFVGDLVSNGVHPYMPDGSAEEWKTTLKELDALPIGTIVPGHGDLGHRLEITTMTNYIQDLQNIARAMVLGGKTDDDISRDLIPSQYQTWLHTQNFIDDVRFLYNQALTEKGRR